MATEIITEKKEIVARTRSSGITFNPPVTHDMVRSLFDPTIKKSFLECCITLTILANFVLCYYLINWFGLSQAKLIFLIQYVYWRLAYNLGIGIILHYQSHYESLTKYANQNKLFKKESAKTNWIASFFQFEIKSKMPNDYNLHSYPDELNCWLLFRQFVDLILMQDFTTYIIYVYLSLPTDVSSLINWKSLIGIAMILFNIWVKIDAHRVVKDYAWYWGDFFFLQDAELTFDGVFNISPHPMYSIGYLGYYGLSLICGDYRVLLVSVGGHFLQFLFLKYVESPHIERTYGSDSPSNSTQHQIDDLIAKENYDYSRPLINTGILFENFQFLRFSDYFTVSTILVLFSWFFTSKPSNNFLFVLTLLTKLTTWLLTSWILFQQSNRKWFTRLFLKNGYTQIYSYQQWQFLYNYSLIVTNTLLFLHTLSELYSIQSSDGLNNSHVIFGLLLCAIQIWCNVETRDAISDFGWFYGDFFLTNYITTRKLTSQGIYRYLNNPEAILGVAGIWGSVLMTNFSKTNVTLAVLWTVTNLIFVKLIEEPHVSKVYGNGTRVSGVQQTLLALKPFRWISDLIDDWGNKMMKSLHGFDSDSDSESISSGKKGNLSSLKLSKKSKLKNRVQSDNKLAPNSKFEIEDLEDEIVYLPNSVTISWKLPISMFNEKDWIGLYNVLETGSDRTQTKIPSLGHWSAVDATGYPHDSINTNSITEFKKGSKNVSGRVTFDANLLYFKPGIYEFRYHSKNSHKVLLISSPFQISFPEFDNEAQVDIKNEIMKFLDAISCMKNEKYFANDNKYFTADAFSNYIKDSFGIELSTDYIRRVNGDVEVISRRVHDIKEVLDSLN
ncbi:hypothetical protein Kpol_1026p17 [Vanderwaltozyma polyspora DSM 70294]|uniref:Phosphatidylethanolamine N-methyltransferase 1 n=1 Tax=Vanderwaltozyma polyspora (strain ATCC 22028 / DSM 70294 / BCRC 21397 / CBS 2163 / NBRC 10782 / NRRL Y-8283 / UCD 57-17) TaxID=436907 RepID=CHO21_VANPO|nr:uncharacterized protein Kpol_1026p17 [Vanderwaltozyma polyspora DSM 70294]A7TNI7.1 RecName: Full=Phosphatidylethanolamine N-methyltransferase 1; Short=PE methyltransferase 1; Short=PEAMT 1; Short=PEMT 1 [Vanderwaltozyma polyspora DSM 70294]EDO16170.1 hypothetical protein Kpol_1026p17 [Vanderwaltozyma polyspora DSM 70294]